MPATVDFSITSGNYFKLEYNDNAGYYLQTLVPLNEIIVNQIKQGSGATLTESFDVSVQGRKIYTWQLNNVLNSQTATSSTKAMQYFNAVLNP